MNARFEIEGECVVATPFIPVLMGPGFRRGDSTL